jgi:hypothetical protein
MGDPLGGQFQHDAHQLARRHTEMTAEMQAIEYPLLNFAGTA